MNALLAERLQVLREARGPLSPGFCERIGQVVVVASSSRGGSSMFMELLRSSPHLLQLHGEINPLLEMAGLAHPLSGTGSDALGAEHCTPAVRKLLDAEFAWEAALPVTWPMETRRLALDLAWRLSIQWPKEVFSLDRVQEWTDAALAELEPPMDRQAFHLAFLARARGDHPEVNPYFYDLEAERVREATGAPPPAPGPPSEEIVEEPPFVLVGPTMAVLPESWPGQTLVIKTPSNAYRLPFLWALFPNARFRLLHLTRNPAASINGLMDGWRYRGFHSHPLETPLEMKGANTGADQNWWKYDLPPGWQEHTGSPLESVCAFQWCAAHKAILQFREEYDVDAYSLRFEDVLGDKRHESFQVLCAWLRIPYHRFLEESVENGLPPVMATSRPRQRRWFARAEALEPVLHSDAVQAVAEALGYDNPDDWV